jgi:hypothetical protein
MAVDFFGRPITSTSKEGMGNAKQGKYILWHSRIVCSSILLANTKPMHQIWYVFNEGFSNAVRRSVTIKELLQY